MKKTLLAIILAATLPAFAQTAPTAPTQASAPAITTAATTRFAAGVTAALGASTTNIIYLEQTGSSPTVSINQDGNSNRAGADRAGVINSMLLNGNSQVVTIDQTGNNNMINTMKITGNEANVYLLQSGDSNTANVSAGLTTSASGTAAANTNALLDFRFTGNSNTANYTGNGSALQAAVYATGNGNTFNLLQSSTVGQQMLVDVSGSNNTVNASQTSASMSSLVLTQNGTGATFNIAQSGAFANAANISAVAAGGTFNIIQTSR
jgi:hypothetical protein